MTSIPVRLCSVGPCFTMAFSTCQPGTLPGQRMIIGARKPPDDVYHAVSRLILLGMVRRARYPGCKFDFMPIFYGKQGPGKSTSAKGRRQPACRDKNFLVWVKHR